MNANITKETSDQDKNQTILDELAYKLPSQESSPYFKGNKSPIVKQNGLEDLMIEADLRVSNYDSKSPKGTNIIFSKGLLNKDK